VIFRTFNVQLEHVDVSMTQFFLGKECIHQHINNFYDQGKW
jgi:hypothetical protein